MIFSRLWELCIGCTWLGRRCCLGSCFSVPKHDRKAHNHERPTWARIQKAVGNCQTVSGFLVSSPPSCVVESFILYSHSKVIRMCRSSVQIPERWLWHETGSDLNLHLNAVKSLLVNMNSAFMNLLPGITLLNINRKTRVITEFYLVQ